ncbi:MAG: hypothetical protein U0796_08925 [Gemmatales bacterium]
MKTIRFGNTRNLTGITTGMTGAQAYAVQPDWTALQQMGGRRDGLNFDTASITE